MHISVQLKRTAKFLAAMSVVKHVVGESWARSSIQAKAFADPAKHPLVYVDHCLAMGHATIRLTHVMLVGYNCNRDKKKERQFKFTLAEALARRYSQRRRVRHIVSKSSPFPFGCTAMQMAQCLLACRCMPHPRWCPQPRR